MDIVSCVLVLTLGDYRLTQAFEGKVVQYDVGQHEMVHDDPADRRADRAGSRFRVQFREHKRLIEAFGQHVLVVRENSCRYLCVWVHDQGWVGDRCGEQKGQ